MAKRKKAAKSVSSSRKAKRSLYRVETYGIKYNSMTFLLFLVFVLVVTLLLVGKLFGMGMY